MISEKYAVSEIIKDQIEEFKITRSRNITQI